MAEPDSAEVRELKRKLGAYLVAHPKTYFNWLEEPHWAQVRRVWHSGGRAHTDTVADHIGNDLTDCLKGLLKKLHWVDKDDL